MSSLNPQQFFHGTTHAIKDGMVRPADDADREVSENSMGDPGDLSEGDHAFVSEEERHAWVQAVNNHPSLRRARVYETGDAMDKTPGPWNAQHKDWLEHVELDHPEYPPSGEDIHEAIHEHHRPEWASPTGFPVTGRIDTMPGRQGTFPGIAWGRFSERPYDQHMNHPTHEQVRYGMNGLADVQDRAMKMNEAMQPPRRRTGAALKAYLRGEPEPPPLADHPRLF